MDKNVRDLFVSCLIVAIIAAIALYPQSATTVVGAKGDMDTRPHIVKHAEYFDANAACTQGWLPPSGGFFGHPMCIRAHQATGHKPVYAPATTTIITTIVTTPPVIVVPPVVVVDPPITPIADTCKNPNAGKDGTPAECNAGGGQEKKN